MVVIIEFKNIYIDIFKYRYIIKYIDIGKHSEATMICNLYAKSGKKYSTIENGFLTGQKQYIDRDYLFEYVPEQLSGCTYIQTAGNDKMIHEDDICFSFESSKPITVYIIYADKLLILPNWLNGYCNTREKVTRTDSNIKTLKGIFTLYAKDFEPGQVIIYGNLSPSMARDPKFLASGLMGENYCMYSVAVKEV